MCFWWSCWHGSYSHTPSPLYKSIFVIIIYHPISHCYVCSSLCACMPPAACIIIIMHVLDSTHPSVLLPAPPLHYVTAGDSSCVYVLGFYLFLTHRVRNTLHHKTQWLFLKGKKSLLDAASSPALSLVTNGHHFRVPNYINVSSGTGLPAYVILPAQFLPPTSLLLLLFLLLLLLLSLSPSISLCLSPSPSLPDIMWCGLVA